MRKLVVYMCAAVFAIGSIAGCGDDSGASTADKAEFVKEANAICEEVKARIEVDYGRFLEDEYSGDANQQEEVDPDNLVDEVVIPNVEREVDQIRALGIPSGDEEEIEAILDGREQAVDEAVGNAKKFVDTNGGMFDESSKLAREYGLKACAER
jgi:hypothetical protein